MDLGWLLLATIGAWIFNFFRTYVRMPAKSAKTRLQRKRQQQRQRQEQRRTRKQRGGSFRDLMIAVRDKNTEKVTEILRTDTGNLNQFLGDYSPLLMAIEKNSPPIVELLLNAGASANFVVSLISPLLMCITSGSSPKIFHALLNAGADVNFADVDGDTALMIAASLGYGSFVDELLKRGADAKKANNEGITALHRASEKGFVKIARSLLDHGANINALTATDGGFTPLMYSLQSGSVSKAEKMVDLFVERGADLNIKLQDRKITALLFAVSQGFESVVKKFIAAGADVNAADFKQMSPILLAAKKGNQPIFKALVEAGANPNAKTITGETLVTMSVVGKDKAILKEVLGLDLNLNEPNEEGETALHYAVHLNEQAAAMTLLEAGADPDISNKKGETPLILAIRSDNIVLANLLLKGSKQTSNIPKKVAPANPTVGRDSMTGKTALMLSLEKNHVANIQLILEILKKNTGAEEAAAHLNAQDFRGNTVLFYAAERNNTAYVKAMLGMGADPAIANRHGNYPFQIAGIGTEMRTLLQIPVQDPVASNNVAVGREWAVSKPSNSARIPRTPRPAAAPTRPTRPTRSEERNSGNYNDPSMIAYNVGNSRVSNMGANDPSVN